MSRIYASAADHINQRGYQVMRPSNYEPSPKVVNDPDRNLYYSVYDDPDPYMEIYDRLPICEFIQMRFLGVSFKIIHHEDILEIYHTCMYYLDENRYYIEADTGVQTYVADKFLPFLREIEESGRRILNFHPDWKDVYMQKDNGIYALIHELLRAKGHAMTEDDPFAKVAHAHPLTSPAGTHPLPLSLSDKLRHLQDTSTSDDQPTSSDDETEPTSMYGIPS